jgi:hypothetical protein
MNSTIPDSDVLNWIIAPVGRAVSFVAEEMKLAGVLHRGLIVLEGHEPLLRVARERFEVAGAQGSLPGVDQLLAEAPLLSQWAAELRKEDYATVNSHSLISIWSAVEVAVEDTVVLILSKDPSAVDVASAAGVKTTGFDVGPLSEEEARKFFSNRVQRKIGENLRVGEFYIKVLGLFGLTVSLGNHILSKLEEANCVRNCIMHRGGVIDSKAAQSVAALRPFLGRKLPITKQRYIEYYDAVGKLLGAIMDAAIASKYITKTSGGGVAT